MKILITILCLMISSLAVAGDFVLLPRSSTFLNGSYFDAEVCLGRMKNGVIEPLANLEGDIGVVHVRPNKIQDSKVQQFATQDGRVYHFATLNGQGRTYPLTLNDSGCIKLRDKLDFGGLEIDREKLVNGPHVEFNYRGRSNGIHDPIAERSYGIVSDIMERMLIVHIQHNLGVESGRVFIEVSK